ncbi:WecB/TagA/CpsF family glycosyltransferase [Acaryochloris sp. IP29b_bin.148]|uniref:WecB/TagA/CpsF family glycosyltransferase n=1 Tax=Acaryochloris sp. IP29b_bin.148 TaxID=2969218 RepID=UPI00262B7FB8|nr:WecB/TagA/CpsF family glycosyltransferase [Acaryochloris sp. IP29b_bin.148]
MVFIDDFRSELPPVVEANLLSRKLTCMTAKTLVSRVNKACQLDQRIVVANYNINSFNLSVQFSWFYDFLQKSEITHCDGLGVLYALRFMGYQLPKEYRVSYSTLMPELLRHSHKNNLSVFLLGAKPEVLQVALTNIYSKYSGLELSGHHGYFAMDSPEQNEAVITQINNMSPNILVVGMGMPRQEYWIHQNLERLNVNAILLGGAVIDRLAGIVEDCPIVLSNNGLEWLYRLAREPKRLLARYLLGNPAFALQVALAKYQSISLL